LSLKQIEYEILESNLLQLEQQLEESKLQAKDVESKLNETLNTTSDEKESLEKKIDELKSTNDRKRTVKWKL